MLAIVAGAAAITACQKENLTEGEAPQQAVSVLKPMTFTAYMEGQDPATKASIDASHYALDQLYDVIWSTGDKIGVYDGAEKNNGCQAFTLNSGAGSANAEFIGEAAEAQTYYAIYPYVPFTREEKDVEKNDILEKFQELAPDGNLSMFEQELDMFMEMGDTHMLIDVVRMSYRIDDETFLNMVLAYATGQKVIIKSGIERDGDLFKEVVIPSEQTVAEGQCVDPKAMLMIAKSNDASVLLFKNVCAYVRVTPQFDCHAICVRSNGSGDLAGTVTLNYNNGTPSTEVKYIDYDTSCGSPSVCLTGTITAGNTYYIAVRPETTVGGFTIEFLTKDKSRYYGRSSDNNLGLVRSEVVNLGEFSTGGAWTYKNVPTSGNDGNGHNWKLVTPTLKLAAETEVYGTGGNYIASSWGADWDYPSREEINTLINGKGNSGTAIFGVGVLKYVEPQINVNAYDDGIWLSDTGKDSSDRDTRAVVRFGINDFSMLIYTPYTYGVHYKYTK